MPTQHIGQSFGNFSRDWIERWRYGRVNFSMGISSLQRLFLLCGQYKFPQLLQLGQHYNYKIRLVSATGLKIPVTNL